MRTETLTVDGMTCSDCVDSVTKALKAVDGVAGVDVSLSQGTARVDFDERRTSVEHLRNAVEQAGFETAAVDSILPGNGGCCGGGCGG